ncbi:tRNA (adenosine(37)-N6)-threonylcarbamoyltransferase complex ATPase subunit type 1 TsaE [Helicobacter sp. 12S02634-8]|uniref:tRNA (adenosine(37)-N6)-threonylcarbamoyltransferase complex ATPase subunit type 1 TsaE n=1 Tax=Helicobacter sp. 12S02634-8 TaxID=1476199 RepID=UPI000BDC91FE|nr:tRNA (adenosine(37)-N6)-threonylcarbamoyltransferase complex ATPase subunit type 1 TsaE [Helicobacter sp. 12S02634-8]PAF46979.1 tRNA (adenosine(37)-N6)-threonylcarbamoyltransferase complex ATPase subunit type 1 TsaE [Helicobacter sp. 12S02634-8]
MREFCTNLQNIGGVIEYLKKIAMDKHMIFLLQGDLASGKTSLVQAYVASFYPSELVTSPTFSLMHQYRDIYHYDLYNRSLEELLALGFLEWLENEGTHFVEWGDGRAMALLRENGYNTCVVTLSKHRDERIYRIFDE